ncbi:MAG: phage holin family protein [Candidatus Colwellbacteria bacterium]|nr:phage holin family protein [Candidatus Colwellbacteria bacterium]
MKPVSRIIIIFLINGLCLYAAGSLVSGFTIPERLADLALVALVFTVLNLIIKPFLRFIFTPIIWLTLGLAGLALNALMLIILDKIWDMVIINGMAPLAAATVIITIINYICRLLLLPKS